MELKPFEEALLELERNIAPPEFVLHPLATVVSASPIFRVSWPELPPSVHPTGAGVPASRSERKCWQIESMLSLVALILERRAQHIVDFGGGTGALAVPLAKMMPDCSVTIVDVSKHSLGIAVKRAREAGLTNLSTWHGDIRDFKTVFDLGLALHACGEASDLALEACVCAGARFVVSPCCVGKLSDARKNNVTWNASGKQAAESRIGPSVRSADPIICGSSVDPWHQCS